MRIYPHPVSRAIVVRHVNTASILTTSMGQNTAGKAAVKLYRPIIVPEPRKHNAEGSYAIHTRNLHVLAFGAGQAPAQKPNTSAVLGLTVKQCCILPQQ